MKHQVQASQLHPLAVAEAKIRSGGDRARWRIRDARSVLVVNFPGWEPAKSWVRARKRRESAAAS